MDIRHEPQPVDLDFMEWLGTNGIPFAIIFTKADKLKPAAVEREAQAYLQKLIEGVWEEAPPHFITSSSSRLGRDTLLEYIDSINKEFQGTQR